MAKKLNQACVLAINGGSSSIKFVLYEVGEALEHRLYGKIDRIGLSRMSLSDGITHDCAISVPFVLTWQNH